ncbi:hypothetical protein ABT052_44555 [Streptomyces sp. NPDC002766]|uniref:hypothetical protein n=1 Tax=Streptomyces sp. NPDC002766 TaxID=3154429 RepID=UPI003320906E
MKGLDPDASNDNAALTLRLAQGGSAGDGAAGGSGSVAGGPSAGSGSLAATGFGGGRILWAAGALLLAGGMAVALSRRSRGRN